jgi:gas vesicle protein
MQRKQTDLPLGELFTNLSHEFSRLVRQELALAKIELKDNASRAARDVGLAWLWTSRSSTPRHYRPGYRRSGAMVMAPGSGEFKATGIQGPGTVGHLASQAQESAASLANQASAQLQQTASQVQGEVQGRLGEAVQQAEAVGGQVENEVERVVEVVEHALDRNPLAVGAAALALSVVAGLSLPETDGEHRLMGNASEQVLDAARNAAEGALENVQQAAKQAASTTSSESSPSARPSGGNRAA